MAHSRENSGGQDYLRAGEPAAATEIHGPHHVDGHTERAVLLLTIDEAALALAVPRSWLRDKVTARQVPHTRLGRHVRFSEEHLRQIIEMGQESRVPGSVPTRGRLGRGRAR